MFQNDRTPNDNSELPDGGDRKKQHRGFAAMPAERQRELAKRGGRAAHEKGRAHEFSTDEARAAGKKGGASLAKDREHMAEIGRKGGLKRSQNAKTRKLAAAQGAEDAKS